MSRENQISSGESEFKDVQQDNDDEGDELVSSGDDSCDDDFEDNGIHQKKYGDTDSNFTAEVDEKSPSEPLQKGQILYFQTR